MKGIANKLHFALTFMLIIAISVGVYWSKTNNKIAYVNSTKLVNNYQGMIDAREKYKQKSSVWSANIDTLKLEVQRAIQEYNLNKSGLSARAIALSEELIRTKQKQLHDYQKALNEKAAQEDTKLTSSVLNEVNAYIKKYGDEYGYKVILVATQYGNIAYADESIEITDTILEGLNKQYFGN